MRKLTIPLTDEEFALLDTTKRKTGIAKTQLIRRALMPSLWNLYGILWPGYVPTECHFCERPMSAHVFIPRTATEPGGYECPGDDEVGF